MGNSIGKNMIGSEREREEEDELTLESKSYFIVKSER